MFRKSITYISPKYLKFGELVKVNVHNLHKELAKLLQFEPTTSHVTDIVQYDVLLKLFNETNRDINRLNYIAENALQNALLIENSIKHISHRHNVSNLSIDMLKKDLEDCTEFDANCEHWNITNLSRKYDISGKEVCMALVNNSMPYGAGMISFKPDVTIDEEYDIKTVENKSGYVYFDWFNGCGVKNSFPIDIQSDLTPFVLNMRRYNDRNYNSGYIKFLSLVLSKLDNPVTFVPYVKQDVEPTKKKYVTSDDICKHNALAKTTYLQLSGASKSFFPLWRMVTRSGEHDEYDKLISHKQNYCNYRSRSFPFDDVTPYAMTKYYDMYVSNKLDHCELLNGFELGHMHCVPTHKLNVDDISMVNMLIYGKTNLICNDQLERLLSYVRVKQTDCSIQLDNYVYVEKYEGFDIEWNDENIDTIGFASSDKLKREVAKYLLQIMNEVDPVHLNHVNYALLVQWYTFNDLPIQYQPSI
jgi:hypothetical protein